MDDLFLVNVACLPISRNEHVAIMTPDEQLKLLLKKSQKQRRDFAKMPPGERRKAFSDYLRRLGVIDRKGRLTPNYR